MENCQAKAKKCGICKRSFNNIPFGHRFRTSWGAIDVCELCTEDLYTTVMADLAGGIFTLRRDIEELRQILFRLVEREKIKDVKKT